MAARFAARIGLVAGSVLVTASLAEIAIRVFRLDGFAPADLHDADGRSISSLSEITTFFGAPGAKPERSMTQSKPGTIVYG